ncbi:MAG: efflux transporter outer membrane subunit [Pirellulaceae bacterium]
MSFNPTQELRRIALGGLALCLLMGCRVGPDYARPAVQVNMEWSLAEHPRLISPSNAGEVWSLPVQDPVLDELVCVALSENLTLRAAGQRIIEAEHRRGATAGSLFPQSQVVQGTFSKSSLSSTNANFIRIPGVFEPNLFPQAYSTGLAVAWELDFWGKYRRAVEVADAGLEASFAANDQVALLLVAGVSQAYVEMRMYEMRQVFAQQNLEIQQRTFDLTRTKFDLGLASLLDVAQAETNVGQTEALLPLLETGRRQASNRLCLLLGRPPQDLANVYGFTAEIPAATEQVATAPPALLVNQRPDVRQVERQLAAQSARIGIAQSELYPQLSVIGQAGLSSENFSRMFSSASQVGMISPGFSWKILNYRRLRNTIEAEKAAFLALCQEYQHTVLRAQGEVEDAQLAFVNSFDRADSLSRSAEAARISVEKAQSLYDAGTIDFTRLYILQADLLMKQDQMAEAKAQVALEAIGLMKASGTAPSVQQPVGGGNHK